MSLRARQAYCRPTQADTVRVPDDSRDVVLLCHGTPESILQGQIDLNNLPNGRIDVLARCTAASLFVSHAMRKHVRVWLMLSSGVTICCDGGFVKGLHPDERTIGAAIRKTLLSHSHGRAEGLGEAPVGWSVHADDSLETRLKSLMSSAEQGGTEAGGGEAGGGERGQLLVLHELGQRLTSELLETLHKGAVQRDEVDEQMAAGGERSVAPATVLVVGDHQGFTIEEEKCLENMAAVRANVSPVSLLASHCIVLAMAVLDEWRLTPHVRMGGAQDDQVMRERG